MPEPFFVHSDQATGVQTADLIAYVISWGFRTAHMAKPARKELAEYARHVTGSRCRTTRNRMGNPNFEIWSLAHITDLRTRSERGVDLS